MKRRLPNCFWRPGALSLTHGGGSIPRRARRGSSSLHIPTSIPSTRKTTKQAIFTLLGRPPASAIVIELRRSFASQAIDDAVSLCAKLLGQIDGVVDDTYSEVWTSAEIQTRVIKHDGAFLDCYRNALAGEASRALIGSSATRWLRWYELDGDRLIGEEQVDQASLAELREIFEITPDDPMYECYPVAARHIQRLTTLVSRPIELSRFAYFVEADAIVRRAHANFGLQLTRPSLRSGPRG